MQRIVVSPFQFDWSWFSMLDPCSLHLRRTWIGMIDMVLKFFLAVSIFAYRGEGGMSLVWVTSAGKKDTLDASP
jgi:hypothetical protein